MEICIRGRRPSASRIRIVSTRGTVEVYETSHYLTEGAPAASEVREHVLERRSVDLAGLADGGADAVAADDVDYRHGRQQGVDDAPSAGCLGHLAGRVARHQPRHAANRTVLHAREQIVLPAAHSRCATRRYANAKSVAW